MIRILFLLALLQAVEVNAQLMDSIPGILQGRMGVDARLESRFSFIDHSAINVNGARLGVIFKKKLRFGGGISWLNSEKRSFDDPMVPASEVRYLKFAYTALYADVVFYRTKRWQLNVPLQFGAGMSWFQASQRYQWRTRDPKYLLLLYEPGVTIQFKLFKWFGIGADVAYRFSLNYNPELKSGLNSPTYAFKILFWPDQIFYELFPEHPISKRFGPASW